MSKQKDLLPLFVNEFRIDALSNGLFSLLWHFGAFNARNGLKSNGI